MGSMMILNVFHSSAELRLNCFIRLGRNLILSTAMTGKQLLLYAPRFTLLVVASSTTLLASFFFICIMMRTNSYFQAPLYWDIYAAKGFNSSRICFTCHNFEYQGTTHFSELSSCGLDIQRLNRPDRMQDNSSPDKINPLKVTGKVYI